MIRELEQPEAGSEPVHFPDKFAVSRFSQLSTILWKNRQVYWRYTGELTDHLPCRCLGLLHSVHHSLLPALLYTLVQLLARTHSMLVASEQAVYSCHRLNHRSQLQVALQLWLRCMERRQLYFTAQCDTLQICTLLMSPC